MYIWYFLVVGNHEKSVKSMVRRASLTMASAALQSSPGTDNKLGGGASVESAVHSRILNREDEEATPHIECHGNGGMGWTCEGGCLGSGRAEIG